MANPEIQRKRQILPHKPGYYKYIYYKPTDSLWQIPDFRDDFQAIFLVPYGRVRIHISVLTCGSLQMGENVLESLKRRCAMHSETETD